MNLYQKKHDWILGGFEFLHVDNVVANAGSGGSTFATDDIAGIHYPRAKVSWGVDGSAVDASATNPLPIVQTGTPALPTGASTAAKQPALGTAGTASADVITVQGIASMTPLLVNNSANVQPVNDNSGSLTVDSLQLPTTIGQKTAAASTSVTLASDQAALPITDNSGSLTVDFSGQKTSDYDTGVGTDTVLGVGIFLPASGGAVQGGTATNPIRTDPTGTTAQPVSGTITANAGTGTLAVSAASLPLPAGASTAAKQPAIGTAGASSADVISVQGIASGTAMPVSLASVPSHAVTNAGTFATQATLTAETTKVIGTVNIAASQTIAVTNAGTFAVQGGQAAHDAAIAGSPVRAAGRGVSADYTAVTTGDTADFITDLNGKQVVLPYAIPENFVSGLTAAITGTADTAVIAAAGVGIRNYITQILVTNSHATVGTLVEIKSAATVLYRGYAAPVGGGFAITFPVPLKCAANEAFNAANITTGSNTYISASGYKAP